jgi:hypothetical protein
MGWSKCGTPKVGLGVFGCLFFFWDLCIILISCLPTCVYCTFERGGERTEKGPEREEIAEKRRELCVSHLCVPSVAPVLWILFGVFAGAVVCTDCRTVWRQTRSSVPLTRLIAATGKHRHREGVCVCVCVCVCACGWKDFMRLCRFRMCVASRGTRSPTRCCRI